MDKNPTLETPVVRGRDPLPSTATVGTVATVNTVSETVPAAQPNLGRSSEALKRLDEDEMRAVYKATDVGETYKEATPMDASVAEALNRDAIRRVFTGKEDTKKSRKPSLMVMVGIGAVLLVILVIIAVTNLVDDGEDADRLLVADPDRLAQLCLESPVNFLSCLAADQVFVCVDRETVGDVLDCDVDTACSCPEGELSVFQGDFILEEICEPIGEQTFECGDVEDLNDFIIVQDQELDESDSDFGNNECDSDFAGQSRCVGNAKLVCLRNGNVVTTVCPEACACERGILNNPNIDLCDSNVIC